MLLLNVNNRSLTSTSEHAEPSDAYISAAAHLPFFASLEFISMVLPLQICWTH